MSQNYTEFPTTDTLTVSHAKIINNDKAARSSNSGASFPATLLYDGTPCWRTDLNGYYIYDGVSVWTEITDAANLKFTPFGNVAAATVQLAIEELDTEKAKLAGATAQPFNASTLALSGDLTTTGLIDTRDVAADGSKVDGIEAGATADQTKGDIDALGIDATDLGGAAAASYLRSDAADQKTAGSLTFDDNIALWLGTGQDTQLYHSGTDTFVNMNVGDMFIRDVATTRFTFGRTTGDFTATGNVAGFSDIRIKANLEPIENALWKVGQLGGYTFDRTDVDVPRQTGSIAQEVQKVLPEAVIEGENGMLAVSYGNMAGLFIEAIKELKTELDDLRVELSEIKGSK
tara:strand:- start:307 stop:1344 length:1038 start_codon:yes stop_codon:yes gene_type:complete